MAFWMVRVYNSWIYWFWGVLDFWIYGFLIFGFGVFCICVFDVNCGPFQKGVVCMKYLDRAPIRYVKNYSEDMFKPVVSHILSSVSARKASKQRECGCVSGWMVTIHVRLMHLQNPAKILHQNIVLPSFYPLSPS